MPGFQQVVRPNIDVTLSSVQRVEIELQVGAQDQRVEVVGGSSILSVTGTQEHGISPETLNQLPLLMNSGPRAAASFATLMPGVSTGGGNNAFDARINGGLQSGDEASLDGVSMQQGFMSQGGMVSIFQDFPMSPDMVSEVKVLTSNYAPEYGSSTSGQIMAVTKSGGSSFHGAGFEFHRGDCAESHAVGRVREAASSSATTTARTSAGRPSCRESGPRRVKSYFYFNYEGYRQTGGSNQPTLSIPSMRERTGDFTDWRDASGNLIPIYDPMTIRVRTAAGGFTKDQFMGCDGNTPNVICPNRISSLIRPWLAALPTPTSGGPLNNYLGPAIPDTILGNSDYYMGRFDLQLKSTDHIFTSVWHQRAPAKFVSVLPQPIASETYSDPQNSWVSRLNWDRTFSQHAAESHVDGLPEPQRGVRLGQPVLRRRLSPDPRRGGLQRPAADVLQRRVRAVRQQRRREHRQRHHPADLHHQRLADLDEGRAHDQGRDGVPEDHGKHPRQRQSGRQLHLRTRRHERAGRQQRQPDRQLPAGRGGQRQRHVPCGRLGLSAAERVDPVRRGHLARDRPAHHRLRAALGLLLAHRPRSTTASRSSIRRERIPAPAGGPAGSRSPETEFGEASYGARYPEEDFYGGFAPRLGAVYRANDKTVLRSGWGIFYMQAFYPGWGGGISQDGFSTTPSFNTSLGGIQPAFFLEQGLPQNFEQPPLINSDYRNGQDLLYRPVDANKRPYSHQWNITVDRELGRNVSLSVGYVGSAGRRLPSSIDPLNAHRPESTWRWVRRSTTNSPPT